MKICEQVLLTYLFQDRLVAMVKARLSGGVNVPDATKVYYHEEYMTQVQKCLTEQMSDET